MTIHTARDADLTDLAADVKALLVDRGIAARESPLDIAPLPGGVSNDVLAVTGPGTDVVVKRALPKLRVDADWYASPERLITEARAIDTARAILPRHVPPLLALDTDRQLMVVGRAPRGFGEWKADLLAGQVNPNVAATLGDLLATLHVGSGADRAIRTAFARTNAFRELRVDPFYRWVSARHDDLASVIDSTVDRMLATTTCLVHGDFSPKNILTGANGLWIIDWEVTHVGDPAFDVAFMLAHLVCKARHTPSLAHEFHSLAEVFLGAYLSHTRHPLPELDHEHLLRQVGCIALARVDGKSPASYLSPTARSEVCQIARQVLLHPRPTFELLWRN
ncbi:phosphotransferase family protein [Gordonia rhizosphera]|uniref:Putative phosphotransferase n=1 Tax=Gordonia rhizosphera NBRC 16068 TaxID=1108045 RepID=K6UYI8_9ACTN|nr:aminoglycoside phosphotransferase family protein [Gordonia rhizosphera]GAB88508.1 putative phosphotransferase [Gordonia rhizosphera NBRC 16068]